MNFLLNQIKRLVASLVRMGMFKKLLFIYIAVILLPISAADYYAYEKLRTKAMSDYNIDSTNTTQLVGKNLEFHFDEMENIAEFINYNKDLQALITKEYPPEDKKNKVTLEWEKTVDEAKISNYLASMLLIQDSCLGIDVFTFHDQVFHISREGNVLTQDSLNNYTDAEWFKKATSLDGKRLFLNSHMQMQVKNGSMAFSIAKLIKTVTGEPLAVVLVDYDFRALQKICSMLAAGNEESIYIADENGTIVYDLNENKIGEPLDPGFITSIYDENLPNFEAVIDGEKMYVTSAVESASQWKLIMATPVSTIMARYSEVQNLIIFVTIMLLLVITFIYVVLLSTVYAPLKKLSASMNAASKGNLDVTYEAETDDEIKQIGESFNTMIYSIKNLMKEQQLFYTQIKDSEIKALQAQINPHFLYNTLNVVKWMAIRIHSDEIRKMIDALVGLLKTTVYNDSELLTLEVELENVRKYVYIQNIRYDNRFKIDFKVENGLESCLILKMLLQPVVENSIFHGFGDEAIEDCQILVRCARIKDKIVIAIEDNGAGIDEGKMLELLSESFSNHRSFSGIGLKNIDERIKLNYGGDYGMAIDSKPFHGTLVKLTLPYILTNKEVHGDAQNSIG